MMRTIMLIKKSASGEIEEIAGPCIETDAIFDDGLEIIDECLFKSLHPIAYRKSLLDNLTSAVTTWIEKLYSDAKPYCLDGNAILTDQFIIQVTPAEVHVLFYFNCPPTEAATLVLHLKENLPEEIPVTITAIPIGVSVICQN